MQGPVLTSFCGMTPCVDCAVGASGELTVLVCQTDKLDVLREGDGLRELEDCLIVAPAAPPGEELE